MPWNHPNRTKPSPQGWTTDKETIVYHFSQNISGSGSAARWHHSRRQDHLPDDTNAGFWLGIDTDGLIKLNLGTSTHYLKWTGTGARLSGNLNGRQAAPWHRR